MFKKKFWILIVSLSLLLAGCGKGTDETNEEKEDIVIGFSQIGAESAFRSANTNSMKDTFTEEKGYRLIVEDGQQKQENQIMAIRMFIQQEVDYIILAPVTESGWDTVLGEAREAGIPVIIMDRRVDVVDEDLFVCWVGSDFGLEGRKMGEWLYQFTLKNDISSDEVNIVNIQGTIGATAQIGRTRRLNEAVMEHGWNLLAEESGDFTEAKGKEVMEKFLTEYPELNVVYCENDNEAFGAIKALEEAGKTAGSDIHNGEIMVLSFDGVDTDALNLVSEGKISCIAECNPLCGPWVEDIIEKLEEGKLPDKYTYIDENLYSNEDVATSITINGSSYMITKVTLELLKMHEEKY